MKLLNPNLPPNTLRAHKLQALVLDWAGTTVDFGSLAPARTLQQVFADARVSLSDAEVRRDMGLPKRDHIQHILSIPRVAQAWQTLHGHSPTMADGDSIYQTFLPRQLSCLQEYSTLIPGAVECVRRSRARGLKIGSTTGYTREMLELLLRCSAPEGYEPDCSLTPEDVGAGRPYPFMLYEIAVRLQVYPLFAMVKIGDTAADIEEGLNAGTWAIGVAGTGNAIGISYREFYELAEAERQARLMNARRELEHAGAHYVIDTLADLDPVLDEIEAHLNVGKG